LNIFIVVKGAVANLFCNSPLVFFGGGEWKEISPPRFFTTFENDKAGVARGNGNKVKEYLECAATPRFLRALRLVEMTKSGEDVI
jgi:hypothetical protein